MSETRNEKPRKYPGNSYTEALQKNDEKTRGAPEKVTHGKVTTRKRGFFERMMDSFLNVDGKSAFDAAIFDVLIPSAKETIVSMIERWANSLFPSEGYNRSSAAQRARISSPSYQRYYDEKDRREARRRTAERPARRNIMDPLIFDTRQDAEDVKNSMIQQSNEFDGVVCVSDLYSAAGLDTDYQLLNYGWYDLKPGDIVITRIREGYMLEKP